MEGQKTRDITGGLPRVAELFEARSPKDVGLLAEITGTISFGKETKGKNRLQITDPEGRVHEELIAKEKNILVHEGQVVNKGELIVDGSADPQDIPVSYTHLDVYKRQRSRRAASSLPGW